jgi:MoxR-like ATPase
LKLYRGRQCPNERGELTLEEAAMANQAVLQNAREASETFIDQVRQVREQLHHVIVGQDEVLDELMICALTGSHALLVGVPGLAKTLMVKTLASSFHWHYARIQFTPDLMPAISPATSSWAAIRKAGK